MLISAGNDNLKMYLSAEDNVPKVFLKDEEKISSNILAGAIVLAKDLIAVGNDLTAVYIVPDNNNILLNN